MDKMEAYIANQVMTAFDAGEETSTADRITAGQTKYNAWFGTPAKRTLYGRYMATVNTLLETTVSPKTNTDYSACIVVY